MIAMSGPTQDMEPTRSKLVSGALALAERLNSRGLGVDNLCKLCQGGPENINHVLFQCAVASRLWSDAGIPLPAASIKRSFEENLSFAFNVMEDMTRSRTITRSVPWLLWLVWKNRNSIMYAETQESTERLLRDMVDEADQWFKLNNVLTPDIDGRACLQSGDSWSPPEEGRIKCNIHANWRNASLHSGKAWIARDHSGKVIHHTRDAIVNAPNRLIAEIRCVIWTLTSLSDLGVTNVIIASYYNEVMEAIKLPLQWPRYRASLHQITKLKENFVTITFEGETIQTNRIARDIARSVLRDGRFQSYLALGGPSWLQDRIAREETRSRD
ncbi:hypothetical protein F2Q70_00013142 [Brassica cretica]|uniref:RNase H type-1 domain-containing protein n=1 Tax=Brassica cretica TaxID=69181 RepID=A0A8S9M9W3_BRACR|nr:hypothetical protein F2Q70_00013142 [Brassica cretica]